MAENDASHKLAFLYKIIDDNQATIRFLDTKAAFGIAVLGAMVGKMLDRDQLLEFGRHGVLVRMASIAFAFLITLCAVLGSKTVFPTVNPSRNASVPANLVPQFFIARFKPNRIWKLFFGKRDFVMLETTHSDYCASLDKGTSENLLSTLAAEALKLSFIRQLKTDRLTAFALALIPTVCLFIGLTIAAPKVTLAPAPPNPSVPGPQGIVNIYGDPKGCVPLQDLGPSKTRPSTRGTTTKPSAHP